MTTTVAVIAPGMMGAGVGGRLASKGARVVTLLEGRSAETLERAAKANMQGVREADVAEADIVLSIVPPGEALALAQRLVPHLSKSTKKPAYVDCNAVNPETAVEVGQALAGTGCAYIDGGIIGGPPREGYSPVIYVSGREAEKALVLNEFGVTFRKLDETIGTASALKMCYGGITKGVTAIATTLALAASRHGIADALRAEMAASQPNLLAHFQRSVPDMFSKAWRWVDEMEEIGDFLGDREERDIYEGIAGLYDRLANDYDGGKEEIDALAKFFRK
jgi:3-hydroxyisobutyrate dehydrogenase-like beta-hydroxyacid dehydrogenase